MFLKASLFVLMCRLKGFSSYIIIQDLLRNCLKYFLFFYSIVQCFLVAGEVEIHGVTVHTAPDVLHGINGFTDYHLCSKGKYGDISRYGVAWLRRGT